MIGEKNKEERLFYYLRPEELIPQDHILRLIHQHVDFTFIRSKVEHLYSHTGRPSVDPEVMMRMLLVGYLFGITSERRLCDEVQMHLGYRWFVGLSLEDPVPDHSTFSKNRHGRFKESGIYQEMFDAIVRQCIEKELVRGKHLTVDSTLVKANASLRTMEPIVVELRPKEYLDQLERENLVKEEDRRVKGDEPWQPGEDFPASACKLSNQTHRSKVDPDARLMRKSEFAKTELGYAVSYLMDNKSRIIVGAAQNLPNRKADAEMALNLLRRVKWAYKLGAQTLGADKGYATGEFVHRLMTEEKILPHVPIMDTRAQHERGIYPIERFRYDVEGNRFICPQGKMLRYWGVHWRSKQHMYRASPTDCGRCPVKRECTRSIYRSLSYHIYEPSLELSRRLTRTRGYRISQLMRKRIEELFGEAKEFMGLRRAKFRRAIHVREQVLLTATTQNIKRMVRLLSRTGPNREGGVLVKELHPFFGAARHFVSWLCDFWKTNDLFCCSTT
ncbi:MAG: IS1182 family transposase [Candidatus Binatia bacterium]